MPGMMKKKMMPTYASKGKKMNAKKPTYASKGKKMTMAQMRAKKKK